jgi:hypothetical protein|tara:strand:- start:2639 stop:2830 length:192 start_codon:yes stop_codon:yes gene_type:complete
MNNPKNKNNGNNATNDAGLFGSVVADEVALVKVISLYLNELGLSDEKSEYDSISVIGDYLTTQ